MKRLWLLIFLCVPCACAAEVAHLLGVFNKQLELLDDKMAVSKSGLLTSIFNKAQTVVSSVLTPGMTSVVTEEVHQNVIKASKGLEEKIPVGVVKETSYSDID